jgi:protein-disulfide isomerase
MFDFKKIEISPSVAILVSGLVIAAAIVYTNLHPAQPVVQANQPAAVAAHVRTVQPDDHIIGRADAPIVLVEYSDFQCPFCSLIYPNLKQIVAQSSGGVAWVMREFPLSSIHPNALPAAEAAECIAAQLGDVGFWKFSDAIFADQSKMSDAYYAQLAKQFGANAAQYNVCVAAQTYASRISADTTEAEKNGGQGTPFTVVINTKTGAQTSVSGAVPLAQLMAVIKSVQ